jgi:hypothetical protein
VAFVSVLLAPYLTDFDKDVDSRDQHLLDLGQLRQVRHISWKHVVVGAKQMEVLVPILITAALANAITVWAHFKPTLTTAGTLLQRIVTEGFMKFLQ